MLLSNMVFTGFVLAASAIPVDGATHPDTNSNPPSVSENAFMSVGKDRVARWLPEIRQTRRDRGLTEDQYPDELVLALIEVESTGDPEANRDNSEYHGLLQMGQDAALDLGYPDRGRLTSEFLMNEGRAAIDTFFRYQERYRSRHEYEPKYIALLWKGGPGTTSEYKEILREEGQSEATEYLSGLWGGSPLDYLEKFRNLYSYWRSGEGEEAYSSLNSTTTGSSLRGSDTDAVPRAPSGAFIRTPDVSRPPGCGSSTVGDDSDSRVNVPSTRGGGGGGRTAGEGVPEGSPDDRGAGEVLDYIGGNYVGDLDAFADTASVRGETSDSAQWTPGKAALVRGFIEEMEEDEGASFAFEATLFDIATSYCQPLVNPIVRQPWGQERSYSVGGRQRGELLRDPETNEVMHRHHLGVDYETRSSEGSLGVEQPCYAIAGGEVVIAETISGYGLTIYLKHDNGVSSRYAHLSSMSVSAGDTVSKGQIIGNCGTSSTRNGQLDHNVVQIPHLHFELRINRGVITGDSIEGGIGSNTANVSLDPQPILSAAPNPGEPLEENDPDIERLEAARESFEDAALNSTSAEECVQAANNADTCAALSRGNQYFGYSRRDFYEAQSRNTAAQTSPVRISPE